MKRLAVSFLATILIGTAAVYSQSVGPACPDVVVKGPPTVVQPGDTLGFRAEIEKHELTKGLSLSWSVDKGNIVKGQGTEEIEVGGTEVLGGQTIKAELTVSGLSEGCRVSFSDTGIVAVPPSCSCLDEFGKLSNDDLKGRIDNLFINLQSDPTWTGYIVSYGSKKKVAGRHALIRRHMAFRDLDIEKIILQYGGDEKGIRSIVSIAPAGADLTNGCCGILPPEEDH